MALLHNSDDSVFYLRFPRKDAGALLAVGVEDAYVVEDGAQIQWEELKDWMAASKDWLFGWIGYDARLSLHRFAEECLVASAMPALMLVKPKHVARITRGGYEMVKGEWKEEWNHWLTADSTDEAFLRHNEGIELKPGISASEYNRHAKDLMHQIQLGNVYEANYCIDFQSTQRLENPVMTWKKMNALTQAPFAGYAQYGAYHVLSASPERYLKREGNRVISQPIKGTSRRGSSTEEDEQLKVSLAHSKKERAENVMIVDLVRNDLSRCAVRGSVRVDELYGLYTFPTVHHLISTVSCDVDETCTWVDLIQATFPMGSMTGAPKISAMNWIDKHERLSRGIYSGALGYIEPGGNFDFNVVIRSLQYNSEVPVITSNVGGAITSLSDVESEYDECLLKSSAVLRALR